MNMGDKRLSATIDDVDAVAHVMEMIAIHAQSAAPILLLGPRSTGASFLAEAIHACSARCDLPFVRARCGLYSGTLLEARLFGRSNPRNEYFLPTASRRKGVIGTANGGSLFVEQIQNTTSNVQTRLLELVANKEYSDFELISSYSADVRLIASARMGLENRVKSGFFLPKLFFRLRLSSIELNGCCTSRQRILSVIDLLRAEGTAQATDAMGRVTKWWATAARSATQTPASMALRRAMKTVAQQFPTSAPVESVFLAALRHMCQDIAHPTFTSG